jgi:hypothetical protein
VDHFVTDHRANAAVVDRRIGHRLGKPNAITLRLITNEANGELGNWIKDRKNRRLIPDRIEKCGYVPVRNDNADDGLWKIDGARQVVYAKSTLTNVPWHSDYDGLILSQSRMGNSSGATRIWMVLATPG